MAKIRLLDQSLINKIAAGEVIERPMSVVKELVENSLDAKATEIIVKLKDGGKKEIMVVDNGEGMDKEDLFLCVKKHATSKLAKVEDLFDIRNYGFRGEALATIAEVARVKIVSSNKDDGLGYWILVEEGKIVDEGVEARQKGTTVVVSNLFYTVPARQKFLKSAGYEFRRILEWLKAIAIPNYKVKFKLYNDGKLIFDYNPKKALRERLDEIYRFDLVEGSYKDMFVEAKVFVTKPKDVFSLSFSKQIFYVNDRPIKSEVIPKAIYKAYQSLIPKNKRPNAFVFLWINPKIVDVNVHPQKLEIRVKNENILYFPVYESIKNALESIKEVQKENVRFGSIIDVLEKNLEKKKEQAFSEIFKPDEIVKEDKKIVQKTLTSEKPVEQIKAPFKIIGQVFDTYIVVEKGNEVWFVDQHVAEERYNFEKLQEMYNEGKVEKQALIMPLSLSFQPEEVSLIAEKKNILAELGFELDVFGNDSIVIRAVPLVLNEVPKKDELKTLILSLLEGSEEEKVNERLATIACKASIKAPYPLTEPRMRQIVDKLLSTRNPFTCPHGRPIVYVLTKKDIDKKVGRA